MEHVSNRQVRTPGSRNLDVADHCKKIGLDALEERKLVRLLGKQAPLHEINANAPQKPPRFR